MRARSPAWRPVRSGWRANQADSASGNGASSMTRTTFVITAASAACGPTALPAVTTLPRMLRQCYAVLHRHKQRTPGLKRRIALPQAAGSRQQAPRKTPNRGRLGVES